MSGAENSIGVYSGKQVRIVIQTTKYLKVTYLNMYMPMITKVATSQLLWIHWMED